MCASEPCLLGALLPNQVAGHPQQVLVQRDDLLGSQNRQLRPSKLPAQPAKFHPVTASLRADERALRTASPQIKQPEFLLLDGISMEPRPSGKGPCFRVCSNLWNSAQERCSPQIGADQEGRLDNGPERKVSLLLHGCQVLAPWEAHLQYVCTLIEALKASHTSSTCFTLSHSRRSNHPKSPACQRGNCQFSRYLTRLPTPGATLPACKHLRVSKQGFHLHHSRLLVQHSAPDLPWHPGCPRCLSSLRRCPGICPHSSSNCSPPGDPHRTLLAPRLELASAGRRSAGAG